MKKVITILALILIIGCNSTNQQPVDDKTTMPYWVINTLNDTTLKYEYVLISDDYNIYAIKDKKIEFKIAKQNNAGFLFIFGFIMGMIFLGLMLKIFGAFD